MRALSILAALLFAAPAFADPMPSWEEGSTKNRIISFVEETTSAGSDRFLPREQRIAVFDNDGTLWSERPVYFQFMFALDRLQKMAAKDPAVLNSDILRAAADGDLEAVFAAGEEGLLEVVFATHSGLTVDEFSGEVSAWLAEARHPVTGLAYDRMVYQPMLELLSYLRDNGYKTYIVSGGGIHFIRAFAERVYGIPPEQVIGSAGTSRYVNEDGPPRVIKDPGIMFLDDKAGKPLAIDTQIGRRPVFAAGNSDGDFQMLEWVTSGEGPRLGILVHHTDAEREYAYDRDSHVGRLDRGLAEAGERGWLLVDMAKDWLRIWP